MTHSAVYQFGMTWMTFIHAHAYIQQQQSAVCCVCANAISRYYLMLILISALIFLRESRFSLHSGEAT